MFDAAACCTPVVLVLMRGFWVLGCGDVTVGLGLGYVVRLV